MYKNLNCDLLGISGRQSEIIELALTYGFRGIDIDMADLVKRCQRSSFESASRFLTSSKLKVGGFEAPIELDSSEDVFATKLAQMNGVAEIARRANACTAMLSIPTATDRLPYPEYFEVVRKRIDAIAAVFEKESVRVALVFSTQPNDSEKGKQFKFIRDVEGFLALVRACAATNVAIVFDSWHWHLGGGSEAHLDQIGVQRVAAIRLANFRDGVVTSEASGQDCLLPAESEVIDNIAYLRKFAEAELKLPVTAAGRPLEPAATRDALVGLAQDALDKTFEAAGIPTQTRRPDMFPEPSYARSY